MAKRKSAGKPRYSKADHEQFVRDLKANDEARQWLAAWLQSRGWAIEPLAPMSVAATPEQWANHSDSGDVWATKDGGKRTRFEVKQRTINFTRAEDFPFPDVVICRCSGFDRAVAKPGFIVLFNAGRTCAAIIDASKWQTWRRESKTDTRHDDLTQEFYVTDLSAVTFTEIPYEFTKAAAMAKYAEETKGPECAAFHPDPKNWKREDVEGGKQRVTCKHCGRFIGYTG